MESSTQIQAIKFAQRPNINSSLRQSNQQVNLISNYIKISFKPQEHLIRQYALKFHPEIPSENDTLRRQIFRFMHKELRARYDPFIITGDSLFSAKLNDERVQIVFKLSAVAGVEGAEEQEFNIELEPTENFIDLSNIRREDNFSQKVKSFIEVVFKSILRENRGMVRFNRSNIFNFEAVVQLSDSGKKRLI
jgi:hypothetical protein